MHRQFCFRRQFFCLKEVCTGDRAQRLEIPSGKCAKLRTVAASNNRDHMPWSLLLLVRATYMYGVVLRANPVLIVHSTQRQQRSCNNATISACQAVITCAWLWCQAVITCAWLWCQAVVTCAWLWCQAVITCAWLWCQAVITCAWLWWQAVITCAWLWWQAVITCAWLWCRKRREGYWRSWLSEESRARLQSTTCTRLGNFKKLARLRRHSYRNEVLNLSAF